MAKNWLELSVWGHWHCNYESDIFVVSVSAVSELNGLSSVLCATSGSNCTWPSVVAAKEQNNIRWKKYNRNTGYFSVFLYSVSYTQSFSTNLWKGSPYREKLIREMWK